MHDPEEYEDPEEFRPERFIRDGELDPKVRDPLAFVFGFGRRYVRPNSAYDFYEPNHRICPGRFFAESGLFIYYAMALHVYNITPPLDSNGQEIKADPGLSGTFLL